MHSFHIPVSRVMVITSIGEVIPRLLSPSYIQVEGNGTFTKGGRRKLCNPAVAKVQAHCLHWAFSLPLCFFLVSRAPINFSRVRLMRSSYPLWLYINAWECVDFKDRYFPHRYFPHRYFHGTTRERQAAAVGGYEGGRGPSGISGAVKISEGSSRTLTLTTRGMTRRRAQSYKRIPRFPFREHVCNAAVATLYNEVCWRC